MPSIMADVDSTQATLPRNLPVVQKTDTVLDAFLEMLYRVVGGIMSFNATMRSKMVSSAGTSEETEERDTEDEVLEEDGDE